MTSKAKKNLTPEQKEQLKIKARRQLKAGIQSVINNLYWMRKSRTVLPETTGHPLGRNVSNLFTFEVKCLLRKPISDRTKEEKKFLFKLISNTKLFFKYPLEVRKGIAGVAYFAYYGPNRVITKQGDPATAFFFIISGELQITQEVIDPCLNKLIIEKVGKIFPGSFFGEIALLNNTPRRLTRTTINDVQLLYVTKDDFEKVLNKTVQAMWNEIEKSITTIPYCNEYSVRETRELICISRLLEFQPEEILLGDGYGLNNFAYIILEGSCRLIESLLVIPNRKVRPTSYELYKEPMDEGSTLNSSAIIGRSTGSRSEKPIKNEKQSEPMKEESKELERKSSNKSSKSEEKSIGPNEFPQKGSKISFKSDVNYTRDKLPPNVEIHYMQLCTMKFGGTFNVGENTKNRRFVAITNVKCLVVPQYWIFSHDKTNKWLALQQFLDRHIPSTKQVFQEFKDNCKWLRYRHMLQEDLLSQHFYPSYNSVHNIPPSYRVQFQIPDD